MSSHLPPSLAPRAFHQHMQGWAEQTLGLRGDGEGLGGGRCGAVQGSHGEHWAQALSCSFCQVHGAQQGSGSIPARARRKTSPVTENGFLDSVSLVGWCIALSTWGLCSSHGDMRLCSSILILARWVSLSSSLRESSK